MEDAEDGLFKNRTITNLPLPSCHIVELPDSRIDCSPSNPDICIRCPILGRFVAGGGLDDYGSSGHVVSLTEWVFTMLIGVFGIFTNCLIITIMKRQNSGRAFDLLLMALACFDLLGSVLAVIASTSTVANFENWGRGYAAQFCFYYGIISCFFARTGSSFMTVLIALERYLVIAFPLRSSTWFTSARTKLYIWIVFGIAAFIALPRFTSFAVKPNTFPRDIASIGHLDYVIVATPLERFWYGTMRAFFSVIDFWFPLPLLLILNILVFVEIRKFAKRRSQINVKQQKEIRAIKMFVPVVVALFLCNIEPYAHYFYVKAHKIIAREHFLGIFLSVAVNSAVNLPIYYFKGGSFRKEVEALFSSWQGRSGGRGGKDYSERSTGVSGLTPTPNQSHSDNEL